MPNLTTQTCLPANAGIAIGPILFVLALLGVLASVFSSDTGGTLGSAGTTDRVTTEIVSQANLIRIKIHECQMQFLVNGTDNSSAPCAGDPYPCSDQTNGTAVEDLTCPADPLDGSSNERSLWTGLRVASMPPPTSGFNGWTYFNAGLSGGRCYYTSPTSGNGSAAIVDGLRRAATKFSSQELTYDLGSASQKFIIFVTRPNGTVDSHCEVP